MKRPTVAASILAFLIYSACCGPAVAENRLRLEPMTVDVGETGVVLPVLLDNDQSLYAFSLSLVTDAALLKIVGMDIQGTAAAGAEWNAGQVLEGGARVSWGVVLDISEPFEVAKVIPAGQGLVIAKLRVDVTATAAGNATLEFKNVPSTDPSQGPDAKNILVNTQGKGVTFTSQSGAITISGGGQEPKFVRGDANADSKVDISDAVYHLNYLFLGGTEPKCFDASDSDDNGSLEITDAIYTLAFLFQGGDPLSAPYPDAGPDPTADPLGCEG